MSFIDFLHKENLKNKTRTILKIQQVLSSLSLNDVGIYLGDGPVESDVGIVNMHSSNGTHWAAYMNEVYLVCYGCPTPNKLSNFFIKRNGHCLFS